MQRLLALALLILLPLIAAADGKVFPTALEAEVKIPDQRALIHFTNGVERLVIETRFTGLGTNFAWVVPLPSQPVVEEASTGLFPTLRYLFRPEIVHRVLVWLVQPAVPCIPVVARFCSRGVAIDGSPRRKPWDKLRWARAAERRKNPAPRHYSFAPAGAWKSLTRSPTARAAGYFPTLLCSYIHTFRRSSKTEVPPAKLAH